MSHGAVGTEMHPWFGGPLEPPATASDRICAVMRHEIRGTGFPYQEYMSAAPLSLPASSYAELFRASDIMVGLLHRLALELGPTTQARLDAFRATERDYPLFVADPLIEERYAGCLARPDVVIGPNGPQFLEFNVSGGFAGVVETHCRLAGWRVLYGESAGSLPFAYHDPFAARADLFRDVCTELALPPRVALVGTIREHIAPTEETRYFDLETDYLTRRGFQARYFEVADADQVWDCAERERYPVGLRHFNVPALAALGIGIEPARRALANGCLLLATQTSGFLGNKMAMGMLSEGRPWMSAAEHAFVREYLPWTRILADRRCTADGGEVELLPYALARQEDLVLKRGIGTNGGQVLIGRDTDPPAWREAVESAALEGTSVVQRFVEPQSCLQAVVTEGSAPQQVPVAPLLGPLLFGRRPAGVYVRYFTDGRAGIVSLTGTSATDGVAVSR